MCCSYFGRKIFAFAATFLVGLFIVGILSQQSSKSEIQENIKSVKKDSYQQGNGIGSGETAATLGKSAENPQYIQNSLKIVSKPRANYTDLARQNNTQGTVTLRVTFLANGQIGNISPVNVLPDGLTEQALAAAAQIKFNPAIQNGKPVTVTKQVQYSFTIY